MTGTHDWALQKALVEALSAHAPLTSLLGGPHLYDRVPPHAALPYVTLGDGAWRDWSTGTETGVEHELRLHVWARDGGRRTIRAIADAIHSCLHDADLTLQSGHLVNLRFVSARILTDPDGRTWHGVLDYRAVTEDI